jgi:hypothetical protein
MRTIKNTPSKSLIDLIEARDRFGASLAAWRRWVWSGALGPAVKRLGRRVMIDPRIVETRLERTGQLLIHANGRKSRRVARRRREP